MNNIISSILNSYKDTAQRTRIIFSTLNVASIILLIGFFNYRLSWVNFESGNLVKRYNVYELQERYFDKAIMLRTFLKDKKIEYDTCKLDFAIKKFYSLKDTITCDVSRYIAIPPVVASNNKEDFSLLTIPVIGVKLYIQDLPLLGGFAVAILLTWYYYARRREKSIVIAMSEKIDINQEAIDSEIKASTANGIAFSTIFSTIEKVDDKKDVIFKNTKFSENILSFLFFAPTMLLIIILVWDTIESYAYGIDSQKYLLIDKPNKEPIYLKGNGVDYFICNFGINYDDLVAKSGSNFKENVSTFKYVSIMYELKSQQKYVFLTRLRLIFVSIASFLILYYCWVVSSKIRKFRESEKPYLNTIHKYIA